MYYAIVLTFTADTSQSSQEIKQAAAALAKCKESQLILRFIDVQVQQGTTDYGAFAVALTTALCDGVDPYTLSLEQSTMRKHLISYLKEGEMSAFPHATLTRRCARRRIQREEKVAVHCSCRLPWDRLDTSLGGLAQCKKCKKWFHELCLSIPKDVFMDNSYVQCYPACAVNL